jgi:hypothetical protein
LYDEIIRKKSAVDAALPLDISTIPIDTSNNGMYIPSFRALPDIVMNQDGFANHAELNTSSYRQMSPMDALSTEPLDLSIPSHRNVSLNTIIPTYRHVSMGTDSIGDNELAGRNELLVGRVEELESELGYARERCKDFEERLAELEVDNFMSGGESSGNGGMVGEGVIEAGNKGFNLDSLLEFR